MMERSSARYSHSWGPSLFRGEGGDTEVKETHLQGDFKKFMENGTKSSFPPHPSVKSRNLHHRDHTSGAENAVLIPDPTLTTPQRWASPFTHSVSGCAIYASRRKKNSIIC